MPRKLREHIFSVTEQTRVGFSLSSVSASVVIESAALRLAAASPADFSIAFSMFTDNFGAALISSSAFFVPVVLQNRISAYQVPVFLLQVRVRSLQTDRKGFAPNSPRIRHVIIANGFVNSLLLLLATNHLILNSKRLFWSKRTERHSSQHV